MSSTIVGNGNPHSFRDIHYLDGKLYKYNFSNKMSNLDKQKIIVCLIGLINERANREVKDFGVHGLKVIAQEVGTRANYSSPDNLVAEDILVAIGEALVEVNDDEVIDTVVNHISEQMSDLIKTNGWCPQGRCTRLFSVYMFLQDYLDQNKH